MSFKKSLTGLLTKGIYHVLPLMPASSLDRLGAAPCIHNHTSHDAQTAGHLERKCMLDQFKFQITWLSVFHTTDLNE